MHDFGTIVTFDIAAAASTPARRFAEALELFAIAASLGSTESLVLPPALQQPRGLTPSNAAGPTSGPARSACRSGSRTRTTCSADLDTALKASAG